MTNEVKHVFMCLLAIHAASLVKCLFKSFPYFFILGNLFSSDRVLTAVS